MVELLEPLIAVLISALIVGSIYSLIAMGLSLLWSTLNLANFAHGVVLVTGAYLAWYFSTLTGLTFSIILVVPVMFLLGLSTDQVLFRKVRHEPDADLRLVLITLTLAVVIEQVLNLIFGGVRRRVSLPVGGVLAFGNVAVFSEGLVAFGVATATIVVTYLILTKTVTGLAIRAIGQNMEESLVVGVNVERVYAITVGVGFALAGIAGTLLGSMFIFNATFGRIPLFIGYAIVVLGGLGTFKGTIYASYMVAVVEALTTFFLGGYWRIIVPFFIIILILLIRPNGLFGARTEIR